jgi:dihydrodipicolinate synthase/N-acetylneuraminate lyase
VEIATVGVGGERADWIAVIKRGLELRGRQVGSVRAPMLPLTDDVDRRLAAAVKAMGLTATPKLAPA